jgi:hypothetical protein
MGEAVRRHLEPLALVLGGLGQCRHGQRGLEEQAQKAVGQVPLTRDVLDQTVLVNKKKEGKKRRGGEVAIMRVGL